LGAIGYYAGLYAYYFSQNLDFYQTGLDVAGTLPVLGEPCDAANAAISAARGDWTGAGLSAASMIPVYGDAVGKGGKAARYLAKYGDDAAAAVKGLGKAADTAKAISPRSLRALRPDPPAGMVKPQWHHDLPQAREFRDHGSKLGSISRTRPMAVGWKEDRSATTRNGAASSMISGGSSSKLIRRLLASKF